MSIFEHVKTSTSGSVEVIKKVRMEQYWSKSWTDFKLFLLFWRNGTTYG